jgi:hypothetical protein
MDDKDTTFVLISDKAYFSRARRTILDLRCRGDWKGSIVYFPVDFRLSANFKDFYGVTEAPLRPLDKSYLLQQIGAKSIK